jgi:DNA repair protein RadC
MFTDKLRLIMGWIIIIIIVIFIFALSNANQEEKNKIIKDEAYSLKNKAKPDGKFYTSPYKDKFDFLTYMAKFLKNKKHEWIFIAFCSNEGVIKFWLNKGYDSNGVTLTISIDEIKNICVDENFNSLIVGHNHPAGALRPSGQDRIFLEEQMDILNEIDVNVEHFVFVAGKFTKYNLSFGQYFKRAFRT